ncbi:MAG: SPOR domain-containing protein [Bacteroidales bacterium]|jgi:glutaredoxin|nr:SPOR domain-containing protein [Bacteroidales bacterium]
MKCIILTVLCCISAGVLQAQTDTLELYTKQSCSHCKWTKATLVKHQIAFAEYDLADDINGDAMLKRLAAKKYKGTIHLPVIFLNDSLIHPTTDTTLSLQKIVNTLSIQQKNGTLHFAKSELTVEQLTTEDIGAHDDCVLRKGEPQYVIIQYEFDDKQQALDLLQQFQNQGYRFAGMVQAQSEYRVYSQVFMSESEAKAVLPDMQRKYPKAYVYTIK